MTKKINNVVARRPSNQPALRKVLLSLETGASVKVSSSSVVQLAGSLSRTTKRRDGTRFSVKSLSNGMFKVTRVKAGKVPVTNTHTHDKLLCIINRLSNIIKEEIEFLDLVK